MKKKLFDIIVIIILLLLFFYFAQNTQSINFGYNYADLYREYIDITKEMNIKNIVSAIYLGPRIFDTFLESCVVILTVFGIKYLRHNK